MFILQKVWLETEPVMQARGRVAAYVEAGEVRWSEDRAAAMLWDCREAAEEAAAALRKAGQTHVSVASRLVSITPEQSFLELERRGLA